MAETKIKRRMPVAKSIDLRDDLMLLLLRHALSDERLVREAVQDLLNSDTGRATAIGMAMYGFADAILEAGKR